MCHVFAKVACSKGEDCTFLHETPKKGDGKGKDKGKVTLPTTLPGRGISYAATLQHTIKKEKGADNIPDFEPPQLAQDLSRKLQILPNEWFNETYYKSDDVAALYTFLQPTQGPFIIVPSMQKEEIQADFNLTSKCSSI